MAAINPRYSNPQLELKQFATLPCGTFDHDHKSEAFIMVSLPANIRTRQLEQEVHDAKFFLGSDNANSISFFGIRDFAIGTRQTVTKV
jgi:hypothetical protein